jgi:hypothetical protein
MVAEERMESGRKERKEEEDEEEEDRGRWSVLKHWCWVHPNASMLSLYLSMGREYAW